MNRLKISCCCTLVAVISFAALGNPIKKRKPMTSEEREALVQARLEYSGGMLEFPGKGFVKILNSQQTITSDIIASSVATLREYTRGVSVKVGEEKFTIATARVKAKADGSAAAMFIVDDSNLPMSLVAMEDGWGVLNVAPLKEGNPDVAKLNARFRKEFLRITALTFGCAKSQYRSSVFQTVTKPADLDKLMGENYTMDAMMSMLQNLKDIGVTPSEFTSYREACEEGRAHTPTNAIEKAIWDEVHATPKKPMQIKFDPKVDK